MIEGMGSFHGDEHLIQQELSEIEEERKLNSADDEQAIISVEVGKYEPKPMDDNFKKRIQNIIDGMEKTYSK